MAVNKDSKNMIRFLSAITFGITAIFATPSLVSAETLKEVKATWSGDGKEPGTKEFADIACTEKGYTSAIKFDPTPASGAYEEDGKIISYMEFKSIECK